ncbi:tyrosine-type recombinase/integrase [Methylobacterium sp. R2-1]|uniref:tyrosine-type recombinase/integrase n=1 Tax=Methylobacterium sp. R2-1 TaxID=2587064 RepID=UPI001611F33A|nr:tyrosine-type recombinase/integrase [Methylobacterium sp. R2-1]MBB2963776.1 integrase [Methylobacterium sp. R2-1]
MGDSTRRPPSPDFLTARQGIWHYARRVPAAFAEVDPRGVIRQSTKIRVVDDPRKVRARRAAQKINDELETFWRASLGGQKADAQARYDQARIMARRMGFEYLGAAEVARLPMDEILGRIEALAEPGKADDRVAEAAVLGGIAPPKLMVSDLFGEFERLSAAELRDLSPDQKRKWANPKKRAVANFIAQVGDMELTRVTRNKALDFRDWWQGRVLDEEMDPDTANKDFGHLATMFRTIERARRLGLESVFSEMRIKGGKNGQRVAFDAAFVQAKYLADGALNGLNDEARMVVYLLVETGLRLSEACNLTAETIRLDAEVPHVMVRPDGRRMKTDQSEREIPLVGVSLMAAQASPGGFPRYRDKAASLSANVNKLLRGRGLFPVEGQTLYSFRHTFEDRLTAVEAPDKVAAALMGHKYHRPRYGVGPSLKQKLEWLQRIAFTPPLAI